MATSTKGRPIIGAVEKMPVSSCPSPMLHPTEKRQKWILTSAGKGGTGKTSTSLNLAVCAAHAGYKVVLIDLDAQKSLSRWHQRRPEQAPEIFLWQGKMTDVTQAISEVGTLEDADLVIVDTPPGIDDYPRESRLLVKKADFIIIPTSPGTADLDSVIEWMSFLQRERAPAAFLLNKVQRQHRRYQEARNRLNAAGPLCPVDVRLLDDIEATHDLGVGAIEIRRSKAIDDIRAVWLFICHQLRLEPAA